MSFTPGSDVVKFNINRYGVGTRGIHGFLSARVLVLSHNQDNSWTWITILGHLNLKNAIPPDWGLLVITFNEFDNPSAAVNALFHAIHEQIYTQADAVIYMKVNASALIFMICSVPYSGQGFLPYVCPDR